MSEKFFVTRNRNIEIFFYNHGVIADEHFKDDQLMTNWKYTVTPEVEHVLDELNQIRQTPLEQYRSLPVIGEPVAIHNPRIMKFLDMHHIFPFEQRRDDEGMMNWVYRNTEPFSRVFREYVDIQNKRRSQRA